MTAAVSTPVPAYRDCFFCCAPPLPAPDAQPLSAETPTWKHVVVLKKKDGEFIRGKDGKPLTHEYILHTPSGDLYWEEKPSSIATKCGLIFFGAPFYGVGAMLYHLGKVVVDIVRISIETIRDIGRAFREKGIGEACKALGRGLVKILTSVLFNLWCVVRDPFFAIAVQFSALVGVISPLNGRRMVAMCEHEWHHQTSYKNDPRYDNDFEDLPCTTMVKTFVNAEVLYLGFCMQTRGNIKENRNLILAS